MWVFLLNVIYKHYMHVKFEFLYFVYIIVTNSILHYYMLLVAINSFKLGFLTHAPSTKCVTTARLNFINIYTCVHINGGTHALFLGSFLLHNSPLTSLFPLQAGLAQCQAIIRRCQFPQASDRLWQGQYQTSDPAKAAEIHQQSRFHTWEGLCWFYIKHSDTSGRFFGAGLKSKQILMKLEFKQFASF